MNRHIDRASAVPEPRIITDLMQVRPLWSASVAVHGNAQCFDWIDCWRTKVNPDTFIAGLFIGDAPVLMLPLETVGDAVRIARYPGGSHANCNFPWLDRTAARLIDRPALEKLIATIAASRPDMDVLSLTSQWQTLEGVENPLLQLSARPNPNPVLAASLDRGFQAVLERSNAKRKLKKHRQYGRRYEEAGGWHIVSPTTGEETARVLNLFFRMKAHRFRQMGIKDTFASPDVQAFFKDFFARSAGREDAACALHALEVNGVVRSVIGKTLSTAGALVEFSAIADDELTNASPGEFLFFEDMKSRCEAGDAIYNFGIGDEPYKREWCDLELPIHDSLLPLTTRGRLFTLAQSARSRIVAAVKNNPHTWQAVKAMRRKLARR